MPSSIGNLNGLKSLDLEENDSITFTNEYSYSGTSLQWTLDDQTLSGDTSHILKTARSLEGVYVCDANNVKFLKLQLETDPIVVGGGVLLKDSLALAAIYHATNGDNWTDNSKWLSSDSIAHWFGVTVENGRVSKLYLDKNNLTGTIPPSFGNLKKLYTL